ncbi:16S rRNA (guanine(966)-N(2))-methyltransferase RsmD [Nitrospirillum viridazoti]|uniref:16S rRNA (Guanine(966)-N(2))-methyltransferase RsmD n=1 Tax=Nitrospirillum viridazoti CBAmc TaxID=1441467 RepID=A0A248JRW0_9PROT|nr:16S rRNA (guanine(966)-N(2))-methyltransferase RsmD [Nitrospirillum amazonense]ASG21349.1 16S rRNA (guanine(966)-N(2))-methyltransferase RsmD [Nitrospirillum amazonense CBAmc]TWB33019.1 16S rRNA (guanine966-N2)-methyltransferase [Nitrospirillum amazonense]
MRIVGGRHRGRTLAAPGGRDVRPTSDRTRQALFNILEHGDFFADEGPTLEGRVVLDAFCGTGALGLEALSRGAEAALFLDVSRASLDLARTNAATLKETGRCHFIQGDATKAPIARQAAGLAFLDPPYGQGLAPRALESLVVGGWLALEALCVVEIGGDDPFEAPPGFETLDERRYGDTRVLFLKRG